MLLKSYLIYVFHKKKQPNFNKRRKPFKQLLKRLKTKTNKQNQPTATQNLPMTIQKTHKNKVETNQAVVFNGV